MSIEQASKIVAQATGIAPELITAELAAGAMPGWDSLGHMRIVLMLEGILGRDLTTDEIMSIRTVQEISALLDAPTCHR